VQVLESLHYINKEGVVQLKGRVACELTSSGGHELLVTELIFSNAFQDLGPAELAAMLSCVVCQERRCQEPNLTPLLVKVSQGSCYYYSLQLINWLISSVINLSIKVQFKYEIGV